MKTISGGVCAPQGFTACGVHCGIKPNSKKDDLAVIFSKTECAAAAVYTTNKVKAAPVYVTMEHLENGTAHAVVANSGNANACAPDSMENARRMCRSAADVLGIQPGDVVVASTGVIGQTIDIAAIERGMPKVASALKEDGSLQAARAIMTTDTREKEYAVSFKIGETSVRVGGIAKGSGMIHPNMGTMLAFLTTDCAITSDMLELAIQEVTKKTFNRVCVDGDTSTNDMAVILANGLAGNEQIEWQDESYHLFIDALTAVCTALARASTADGEGASRLITCQVRRSLSEEAAERLAKAVVASSLVKAAMFGADANWGRVLCAMGYSKAPFRPEYVSISFRSQAGQVDVCADGEGLAFDEELAKQVLTQDEVIIDIDVAEGQAEAQAWGCDLTYDYVKINGDYRT